MRRVVVAVPAACLILAGVLAAQEGVRRGKVKSVNADRGTLTLTVDGREEEFLVTDRTRIVGPVGGELCGDRLRDKAFREGAPVMFMARKEDGKRLLVGVKFVGEGGGGGPGAERVSPDTSRMKPLTELGEGKYQGFEGGLYPGGRNQRPPGHEKAGEAMARQVRPLDAEGRPSDEGKVVLLSIGMSNTTQEFSAFQRLAEADPEKDPRLVIVDGAQGGMSAARIVDPEDGGSGEKFWATVDQRLKGAGVTRAQVQAAWIKEADAGPTQPFPRHARVLEEELARIVRVLHQRFPNLKLVYLSSRIYAGYARSRLNPEPYAYESAFSVKWLIGRQIEGEKELNFDPARGPVAAPWLSWGPHLWANGTKARAADGLTWEEEDFGPDGTHPTASGQRKVARQLLKFFKTDSTTRPWFVRPEKGGG